MAGGPLITPIAQMVSDEDVQDLLGIVELERQPTGGYGLQFLV